MKNGLLMVGAALALAPAAFGQTVLTASYKEGQTWQEKLTAEFVIGGNDAKMTRTSKTVVKEVKKDGSVVLSVQDMGGKASVAGMDIDIPEQKPVMQTLDKQGKLLEFKPESTDGSIMTPEVMHAMALGQNMTFSDKAVNNGDTWKVEYDNPAAKDKPALKDKKVVCTFTLVGTEKVDGVDHLKVTQTSEAVVDGDGNKITTKLTIFLDPKTNIAAKVTGKISDIPTQYGPMTMDFTVITTPGAAAAK